MEGREEIGKVEGIEKAPLHHPQV